MQPVLHPELGAKMFEERGVPQEPSAEAACSRDSRPLMQKLGSRPLRRPRGSLLEEPVRRHLHSNHASIASRNPEKMSRAYYRRRARASLSINRTDFSRGVRPGPANTATCWGGKRSTTGPSVPSFAGDASKASFQRMALTWRDSDGRS